MPKFSAVQKIKDLLWQVDFSECRGCQVCPKIYCSMIWINREEYPELENKFPDKLKKLGGHHFMLGGGCHYVKKGYCSIYPSRPLDCRLFPLDIVEERGKFYWCIYTVCPKYNSIRGKLEPLLPVLEKMFSKTFFREYRSACGVAEQFYPPLVKHRYKLIREFSGNLM